MIGVQRWPPFEPFVTFKNSINRSILFFLLSLLLLQLMIREMQGPILQAPVATLAPTRPAWDTWWTVSRQLQQPWCTRGRQGTLGTTIHIRPRPTRNITAICSPGNYTNTTLIPIYLLPYIHRYLIFWLQYTNLYFVDNN